MSRVCLCQRFVNIQGLYKFRICPCPMYFHVKRLPMTTRVSKIAISKIVHLQRIAMSTSGFVHVQSLRLPPRNVPAVHNFFDTSNLDWGERPHLGRTKWKGCIMSPLSLFVYVFKYNAIGTKHEFRSTHGHRPPPLLHTDTARRRAASTHGHRPPPLLHTDTARPPPLLKYLY